MTAEQVLEVEHQPREVEERPAGLKAHENVDVARGIRLAPSYGPKDAHVGRAVLGGHQEDLLALLAE